MRNKIVSTILLSSILVSCMGYSASAAEVSNIEDYNTMVYSQSSNSKERVYTCGDFKYSLTEDGNAILTMFVGKYEKVNGLEQPIERVVIPATVDGHTVVAIGSYCFTRARVYEIEIPGGITFIDHSAFESCKCLKRVVIPDTVVKIANKAFYNDSDLGIAEIPNSVKEIGIEAFKGCGSLKEIILPDSIESVGIGAFSNCSGAKKLVISKNLDTICQSVFYKCIGITDLVVPETVEYIGEGAFQGIGIEKLVLPEGVRHLGPTAFGDCISLKEVTLPSTLRLMDSNVFFQDNNLEKVTFYCKDVSFVRNSLRDAKYANPMEKLEVWGYTGSIVEEHCFEYEIPFHPLADSEFPLMMYGDVDMDGKVTSADALMILRNSVDVESFSNRQKLVANVDNDDKITSADSLAVLRKSVGLVDTNTKFGVK